MPEAAPQPIMASEMLNRYGLTLCEECGEVQVKNPFRSPIDWLLLKHQKLQGRPHLFRVVNASGSLLASTELVAALRELQPTGIALKAAGEWV
jgi:hypothetical protein